jgi:dTDP-4-amino-4,6-dideoxygalactose transaminase
MIKLSRGSLGEEELEEVRSAFEYGYFGLASKVDEFENQLKLFLGAKHVIATNTGTSALHLALEAIGVKSGDEVIVPSLTFVASFQAISMTGAEPVSCEVHPDTLLLDLKDVKNKITDKTKAIMPVHYAGNPCDMTGLLEIKKQKGIRIIEDAAHAFGSTYKDKMIGSFGDATCFSFDSIKNMTCGEGGAIAFNDSSLSPILLKKRLLGIDRESQTTTLWKERNWFYDVSTLGFRYHMSNINAAIGLAQIKKVESFIARRREICQQYDSAFKDISGLKYLPINYKTTAPHIYVLLILDKKRDGLMQFLKNKNIETGIPYIPNHLHTFYKRENHKLPSTEKVFDEILALPLHPELSNADIEYVITSSKEFFSQESKRANSDS